MVHLLISTKISPQQLTYFANPTMFVPMTSHLMGAFNVPHHATDYIMALLKFLWTIEVPTSVSTDCSSKNLSMSSQIASQ